MSTPYESGRLARERGCYRILCIATDEERAEWLRGYDDRDRELCNTKVTREAGAS